MTRSVAKFDEDVLASFIGVIDLQDGVAVRGVGGKRDLYRPVKTLCASDGQTLIIEGDYRRLVQGYLAMGIGSVYVADLNGIRFGRWQQAEIQSIVNLCRPSRNHPIESQRKSSQDSVNIYIDLGFHGVPSPQEQEWIEVLLQDCPEISLVLATECAPSISIVTELLRWVPAQQLAISFDYQDSRWLSTETTESQWFQVCRDHSLRTVIGLDLAAVGGTSIEPVIELSRRIQAELPAPRFRYVTGGGIRNSADARSLLHSGANGLLVASLFVT